MIQHPAQRWHFIKVITASFQTNKERRRIAARSNNTCHAIFNQHDTGALHLYDARDVVENALHHLAQLQRAVERGSSIAQGLCEKALFTLGGAGSLPFTNIAREGQQSRPPIDGNDPRAALNNDMMTVSMLIGMFCDHAPTHAQEGPLTITHRSRHIEVVQCKQQQLFALNSEFMAIQAKAFAARIEKAATDDAGRVKAAYRIAYQRAPSDKEVSLGVTFAGAKPSATDKLTRWQQYAQILLASNELMYVD